MLLVKEHRLKGEKGPSISHTKMKTEVFEVVSPWQGSKQGKAFGLFFLFRGKKSRYFIQTIPETFLTFIPANFSSS